MLKSGKRVLSILLALAMVLGVVTINNAMPVRAARTEVLYEENFDAATIDSLTSNGWSGLTQYELKNATLRGKNGNAYYNFADAFGWTNYTYETKMTIATKNAANTVNGYFGIRFGVSSSGVGLEYGIHYKNEDNSFTYRVYDRINGKFLINETSLAGKGLAMDQEMTLKVEVEGSSFTIYLNDEELGSAALSDTITGTIGTLMSTNTVYLDYDDMKVTQSIEPEATEKTLLLETFSSKTKPANWSGMPSDATAYATAAVKMAQAYTAYYTGSSEESPYTWDNYTYSAQLNFEQIPTVYNGGYWYCIFFGKAGASSSQIEYGLNYNPGTGKWQYRVYDRRNSAFLVQATNIPSDIAICAGEPIELKATIDGKLLAVYINDTLLKITKASTEITGTVGIIAADKAAGATVAFDDIHVISRDYGEEDKTVIAAEDFAAAADGENPFTEDNGWLADYQGLVVNDGALKLAPAVAPMSRYMTDGYIAADFKLKKPDALTDGTYYPAQLTARNTTIYNNDSYEARLRMKAVKSGDDYAVTLDAVVYSGTSTPELVFELAKGLTFDTVYNLKLLCMGNRIVFTLRDASGSVLAEKIYPLSEENGLTDRAGNFGIQSLAGDRIPAYINNIEVRKFKAYTITDNTDLAAIAAITQKTGTLITPTKFYAGELVTVDVTGDIKAGSLKYTTSAGAAQNIFSQPEGTVRGEGSGTSFVFTMPADNVTLTAEANAGGTNFSIATLATALADTEKQDAIRFLNRVYLPVNEDGEFIKNVTYEGKSYTVADYGAVALPSNLIPAGSELTLETDKIAKVSMFAETAKLYDKTGKYIDFTVKLTNIKNTARMYAVRTYVILEDTDGNQITVYGNVLEQSIDALKAAY